MQEKPPVLDWTFWIQLASWTLDEAVALMLGLHPSQVAYPDDCLRPEVAISVRRLAALVQRAMDLNELKAPLAPADVLKWAARHRIELAPELRTAMKKGMPAPRDSAHPPYRVESVATLVIGVAEEFAEYDAERPNSAARTLSDRLRARGRIISEETIRSMLRYFLEHVKGE